jgi:glycosyltransferase involved in cell wall biosynthesis
MRVCFYIRSLHTGGAERQISLLAPALAGIGATVVLATDYPGGRFSAGLEARGVKLVSLEKRSRWHLAAPGARLTQLMRHEQIDVLYSVMPTANLVSALLRPALGRTRLVWGVRSSDVRTRRLSALETGLLNAEAQLSPVPDAVIFNSESGLRHALARSWHPRSRHVVPNGFDEGDFSFDTAARDRVRAEFGVRSDEKLVGIVARLDPVKDHDTFIRAASILARRGSDARFIVVGEGSKSWTARLRSLAADLGVGGRVRFAGNRTDVRSVFSALDLCCLTSVSEGFPNVLAEAMLCGVPCVSTDVGDARAILGPYGGVVPARIEGALADAIDAALASRPARPLLRDHIVEHFSIPRLARETMAVLEKVARAAP